VILSGARRQQIPTNWGLGGTRRYSAILSGRATFRATPAIYVNTAALVVGISQCLLRYEEGIPSQKVISIGR
jgi:hypothetical protein